MKKLALALTALAAMTGSAVAADLAPRPYVKAPPPVMVPSWTGFYIFGGGGGGIWDATTIRRSLRPVRPSASIKEQAAMAGSERLVLVMIGNSTATGSLACWRMASSAA
jgi:opacity protein-like surface antigen